MGTPYMGEIRLMTCNFAPVGWAFCNGQLLPINQNQALFALLNNKFGGDGQTTFALPNMRGRTPVHIGTECLIGQAGGAASVTLTQAQIGAHTHAVNMSNALATLGSPAGAVLGKKGRLGRDVYAQPTNLVSTDARATTSTGGGQAHSNMQPYATLNFCIALQGIFPTRN